MATIRDLLANDPIVHGLANDGQARLRTEADEHAERELKAELRAFVCDGQYGEALDRIFGGYLRALNRDRQIAAWVSGFFGSGKSHLLKMAGHLWVNTAFADGTAARELVVGLPESVKAHLRELDNNAKRLGVPRVAAMGQLPAGDAEFVRPTIASIVLSAQGLPRQIPLARFVFWLRDQGIERDVRQAVEAAGKNWFKELEALAVSPIIAGAVCRAIPGFAASDADARRLFASTYPAQKTDLSTEDFIQIVRTALAGDGPLPLAVLVLDEVQQYIADSNERAAIVTEAIEALYTQLDSRVLVIAAGQAALSQGGLLTKLRDRFDVQDALSDADVEAVTRKVVLAKKASQERVIEEMLERHSGEIARQLAETAIAHRDGDRQIRTVDYPLLPARRRFWEACFKAVDAAGTNSQLRSQLKVIHHCIQSAAEKPLGYVVPGDALYANIADRLVNTAVLIPELFQRIDKLQDGTPDGRLRYGACGLVFLISKLPREQGTDLGIRSNARTIADLMIEDLRGDSGPFRSQVEQVLEQLVTEGVLMTVDEEYRLQTREGQAWDAAFRSAEQSLRSRASDVEHYRERLFSDAMAQTVGGIRVSQGSAKLRRELQLHYDLNEPPAGQRIAVWVRDGWGAAERDVLATARAGGTDDPVVHVFIPKKEADALRSAITESLAAQKVLDQKGLPSTREGEEAHQSMASRKASADQRIKGLVQEILREAAVYQGGGSRLPQVDVAAAIEAAAMASVGRLYPRFGEADAAQWGKVIEAAKNGTEEPLSAVGYRGQADDHPVCREVLKQIGSGEAGNKIRKELEKPPFGWPRDAVDAALMVLHRAGIVGVTGKGGAKLAPGMLDQNLIPTAEFRPERVRVNTAHRIAVRGLCSHCGLTGIRSGEEEAGVERVIAVLRGLAAAAGGEAPRPTPPTSPLLDELESLHGGERLLKAAAEAQPLKDLHDAWKKQADLVSARLPAWNRASALAARAAGISECGEALKQLEAIREGRLLLHEPDPVAPLLRDLSTSLRSAVLAAHENHVQAVRSARATIERDSSWQRLDEAARNDLISAHRLEEPPAPDCSSDETIARELEAQSIEARRSRPTLVSSQVGAVLSAAAKRLAPQSTAVKIDPTTLNTSDEVEAWIEARRKELLDAVRQGPVVIG